MIEFSAWAGSLAVAVAGAGGGEGDFSTQVLIRLILYLVISLVFSFLCSVAEAVLLSVNGGYIDTLSRQGSRAGDILGRFKTKPSEPLAAILTINTVAHTVGAAGVGHEAAVLFGEEWLGVSSGIMTILILVGSEIIPKTLGATYWRRLAPGTAYSVSFVTWLLKPVVKLLDRFTGDMAHGGAEDQSRAEIESVVWRASRSGTLSDAESRVLQNVFELKRIPVKKIMTPRVVVFRLPQSTTVEDYRKEFASNVFSRIPVSGDHPDEITGFVLRSDVLAAPRSDITLESLRRELPVVTDSLPVSVLYNDFINGREHLCLVVNEYGDFVGIASLEDVLETLIGVEIVDETDPVADMRRKARELGRNLRADDEGASSGS